MVATANSKPTRENWKQYDTGKAASMILSASVKNLYRM